MWSNIFNPENRFFRGLGKAVDVAAFSLLWLAGTATVALFGPSTTALYDAMARSLRKGEAGAYWRYFDTLKSNFKTACPVGVLVLTLYGGLYFLHGWLLAEAVEGDQARYILYVSFWIFLIVFAGTAAYLFPTLSRFEFGPGGLIAVSLRLAMAHLPTTLLLGGMTLLFAGAVVLMWWPGLFLPYLWARLACPLLERIFKPFMEEQGKSL